MEDNYLINKERKMNIEGLVIMFIFYLLLALGYTWWCAIVEDMKDEPVYQYKRRQDNDRS
jgi:hypothetical protein